MIKIECDCSINDLCPQGRFGASQKCTILLDRNKDVTEKAVSDRDNLWCKAVVNILNIDDTIKLLQLVSQYRGSEK